MYTVVVQQQITTIELMKEQSKKQKKTKNKRIKISCMKGLINPSTDTVRWPFNAQCPLYRTPRNKRTSERKNNLQKR